MADGGWRMARTWWTQRGSNRQSPIANPNDYSTRSVRPQGVKSDLLITSLRIARFEDLVRKDPHRSLIHHALTAGFGSYPQFHRAFRTVTGRTPGAWAAEQTGSL